MLLIRSTPSREMGFESQTTQRYSLRCASSPSLIRWLMSELSHGCSSLTSTSPLALINSATAARLSSDWYGRLHPTSSRTNGLPPPSIRTSTSSRPAEWKSAEAAEYAAIACVSMHSCTDEAHFLAPSISQGDCGRRRESLRYLPLTHTLAGSSESESEHGGSHGGGGKRREALIVSSAAASESALATERTESRSTGWPEGRRRPRSPPTTSWCSRSHAAEKAQMWKHMEEVGSYARPSISASRGPTAQRKASFSSTMRSAGEAPPTSARWRHAARWRTARLWGSVTAIAKVRISNPPPLAAAARASSWESVGWRQPAQSGQPEEGWVGGACSGAAEEKARRSSASGNA
mmetsp:Transcript_61881/g.109666  ORF Transcript_61881/g.109666 Transcript_61881/m.109666 type:complete len:349 (-) Transcript_61881:85-1131(-)